MEQFECSVCSEKDRLGKMQAYNDGWIRQGGKTYCPACAKSEGVTEE